MVLIHGVLLHGSLSVTILCAEDLWLSQSRSHREKLARAVLCNSTLNPYATLSLEHLPKPSKRLLKTHAVPATDRPTWNHAQTIDVATNVSYIIVHVKSTANHDAAGSAWGPRTSLGFVRIKAEHVLWNVVDGWFPLTGLHGIHQDSRHPKNRGRIRLSIRYSPVDSMMLVGQPSVPGTYFSAAEHCHVQLFQDAHCPDDAVMHIPGSSDPLYSDADAPQLSTSAPALGPTARSLPARCRRRVTNYFEQIYFSILHARKLIYISGWSVDTTLRLLRQSPSASKTSSKGSDKSTDSSNSSTTSSATNRSATTTSASGITTNSTHTTSASSSSPAQMPLGDLLKHKASQGVTVLLLVWDEMLSTSNALVRLKGLMDTRDEVTKAFFRNSKVKAAVVPRLGAMSSKVLKAPLVSCLFTFHEKLVITDIAAFEPKKLGDRELVAFCGGLDLTYGRWDTPQHSVFRTLDGEHAHDFHNGCFDVSLPQGPREPWHDVAAMITGPVVRDFIRCFEERWRRQGLGLNFLVDVESDASILDGKMSDSPEKWTVQVFRSIDERSAVFDKESQRRLETKKGRSIDRSIHHAYVHYTRAAKRFIYIEQQYFLGSSNQWVADGHKDGTNLIPHELALKVTQGILSGNYFRVYVVIPMFPEGVASDAVVQKILFFQMRTIEMMMKKVAGAIAEARLTGVYPTDFIAFFCLGNREPECPAPTGLACNKRRSSSSSSSDDSFRAPARVPLRQRRDKDVEEGDNVSRDSTRQRRSGSSLSRRLSSFRHGGPKTADEEQLAQSRRHPIYQHAKLFISDDEVVLAGSANLNERSMCGVRDTEIAFSAFQPNHRCRKDAFGRVGTPRGEIGRFRRRLWAEHALGLRKTRFPGVLEDPSSIECMREMQRIARRNWADYMSARPVELKSHLLPYPYRIDAEGNVAGIVPEFPDTRGPVTGTNTGVVPNILVS